jgi:PAS domain S-box-containing protein
VERQLTPAAEENEQRFRMIVESTIDYAIFMLDPQGYIVSWNAGAQRIKGYTADEIVGKHFSTFYTAEAIATGWPDHELREAERLGRFEDEGWRVRKDGTQFWANVVITAVRGSDGKLRGFAKVTRDISVRRAHEQRIENLTKQLERRLSELAQTNRELAQKSAENENFVYSVSHDLRSPLVNLQGFSQELMLTSGALAQLLSRDDVPQDVRDQAAALLDGDLTESIAFIRNAVRHLGNIIDGLLRLSRIGRIEYHFEPVDVGDVVRDILSAMHSTITEAGAEIDVQPLPVINADRNAIGQIFANILGNALKAFGDSDNRRIQIAASSEEPPVFRIADNGIGIPIDYQRKVFQPFQQVHPNPRARGEGMGLAIVQRIIARHGGRIWFTSAPGAGTTFFFTLAPSIPAGATTPDETPS